MPFIGQQPITGAYSKLDAITTSATATYNLLLDGSAYFPSTANHLLVSLNGVMQAPQDSFTVSGSTIIFDSALTSSDSIDFIMALGDVLNIGTPSDGTVTAGKIAANAVTTAKIASGAVTDAKIASGISSSKLTGALPAIDGSALTNVTTPFVGFGVRGMNSVTTIASYGTAFRFASSWVTTDVNQGNLLHANGYGLVPSGQAGVYQISYFANYGASTNYMQIYLIRYIAASTSYQTLMTDLRANDYNYYTVGGTVLATLAVGDQIFAGYNNNYATVALNASGYNRFSMHKIG